MAKKKAEAETEAPAADTPVEKITQKEAVRRALKAGKALPADGVAYIKDTFGIELNKGAFSTLKTQLKKASGGAMARRGRRSGTPAAASPDRSVRGGDRNASATDLVRGLKPLIARFGSAAVKEMADALAD